jgi:2-succinyl-6-hydroxy-2,4-cyclohexadiene-1-carboxylate synthase
MPRFESFYFQTHGNKSNPAIVFLHGFLGNRDSWNEIIPLLSKNYYCITIDLPGHGQTLPEENSQYTMSYCSKLMVRLLDNLKIQKFSLVGYSMGGRLGLFVALNYPNRINRLVLESSSAGLKTKKERIERQKSDENLAQELENAPLEQFLHKWYSQPLFDSLKQNQKRFQQLMDKRKKNNPMGLAKSLRFMGTGVTGSLWGKMADLKIPTLLIVGEYDHKFQEIAKNMSAKSKKITVVSVAGAGHNVHLEQPGKYAQILKSFFK